MLQLRTSVFWRLSAARGFGEEVALRSLHRACWQAGALARNCCYGSGKERDRLASGGKFEFGQACFYFSCQNCMVVRHMVFFFFFQFCHFARVAIIHKYI
jgi:hypothetical protein